MLTDIKPRAAGCRCWRIPWTGRASYAIITILNAKELEEIFWNISDFLIQSVHLLEEASTLSTAPDSGLATWIRIS